MIVYQATKLAFSNDVITNRIDDVILEVFKSKLGHSTSPNEQRSWRNSMLYMQNILEDKEIPDDTGVMIEYQIPQTSKRIDFIITGRNENNIDHAVIVELKQWDNIEITEKDAIVQTCMNGNLVETEHPSYKAWSYAFLINNFNEAVQKNGIE
ncbi:MAG: AAA family ATPase, partial [Candidatus Magasanikiibacteriota bacterium]